MTGGGPRDRTGVDADLMRRVQADDVEAFAVLYDRHCTRAYGVARSICGETDRAEEAVQEGFLSIWRGRGRFRPGSGSFQAWAMAIVRHAAIDIVRREGAEKRPILTPEQQHLGDPQTDPVADQVAARERADALRGALARLPVAQAEIIGMAFFGGLSHREIAERLDLPPGTVKGRMRLGLEKLRAQIERAA